MVEYKIWCEDCEDFVSEFDHIDMTNSVSWLCCSACGHGVVKVIT